MIRIKFISCLQSHTKDFRYITAYEGKAFKAYFKSLYCNKYNKINVCHSDTQKIVYYKKNDTNAISILYTGSRKSFPILMMEMFKAYLF